MHGHRAGKYFHKFADSAGGFRSSHFGPFEHYSVYVTPHKRLQRTSARVFYFPSFGMCQSRCRVPCHGVTKVLFWPTRLACVSESWILHYVEQCLSECSWHQRRRPGPDHRDLRPGHSGRRLPVARGQGSGPNQAGPGRGPRAAATRRSVVRVGQHESVTAVPCQELAALGPNFKFKSGSFRLVSRTESVTVD